MIMAKDSNNNYVKIEDIITQQNSGENLENYRIYGNTVGGGSVGDRTENLFDKDSESVAGFINDSGAIATVPNYPINTYDYINVFPNAYYSYKAFIDADPNNSAHKTIRISYYTSSKVFISRYFEIDKGLTKKTITTPNNCFYIRLSIDDNLRNVMLWRGAQDVSVYEPCGYRVPVMMTNGMDAQTTNIYLPEQIKMVGDEAEYVDYQEQKMHRVRKNLLKNTATSQTINGVTFTVNNDGSITCNGTASDYIMVNIIPSTFSLPEGAYILNGAPPGGGRPYNFKLDVRVSTNTYYPDTGNGIRFNISQGKPITMCRIAIYSGYTCNNLTFYPMIRKADIEDDTYEPYIENTELDVTLPALPTLSGTNTLTVGTNTKPSKVWGKLSDPRDILYVKDNLGNILFSKYHEIEGEPPRIYKAKKAGTLADYRIYGAEGNVGNLRPSLVAATDFTNGYHVATDGTIGEHGKRVATLTPIDVSAINTIYVNSGINTLSNPVIIYSLFSDDTFIERALVNGIETVINTEGANKLYLSFGGESKVTTANLNNVYVMDNDKMYVIPVTVSGKNKFDGTLISGYYIDSTMTSIGAASGNYKSFKLLLSAGTYTFSCNIPVLIVRYITADSYISNPTSGQITQTHTFMVSDEGYVSLAFRNAENTPWDDSTTIQIEEAQIATEYEPYHDPINTNIYLPEQIKMVGDEAEYIDFKEQKQHFADGTSVDVILPALPTLSGTNTLSVGTAVQPSKINIKGKIKGKIYGWHVDPDISNSSGAVTYLEDAIEMIPASMGSSTFDYGSWENAFFMPKPCMLKSNGKVDYYLDPNDYTKKLDGTTSDIANPNYDGNAMMEWPKIWFKYVKGVKKGQGYFYVANYKADGNFHCWCNYDSEDNEIDHFYTAIYNGTSFANYNSSKTYVVNDFAIYDNKLYKCNTDIATAESFDSTKWDIVSNTAPVINKMRSLSGIRLTNNNGNARTDTTTEVTRATANNTTSAAEWYIETFSDRLLINGLLVLMGKSLNTQAVFGRGLDTGGQSAKEAYVTGTLNDKGLFWGVTENGNSGVKIFGMENFWGCCWHRTAGLITNNHAVKLKLTYGTKDGSTVVGYNQTGNGYIDNGISPHSNGYVQKMSYNKYGFMPAVVTRGSQSAYYADYHYQNTNYTGIIYALFGGSSADGLGTGAFYLRLYDAPESMFWIFAASLSCKPLLN